MGEIYQKFISQYLAFIIRASKVENYVRDITSTLWFLEFAGIGFHYPTCPSPPPWAPNFASAASNRHKVEEDPMV
jgi:hypothetical protein